jgi:hypothetical protein
VAGVLAGSQEEVLKRLEAFPGIDAVVEAGVAVDEVSSRRFSTLLLQSST